MAATVLQYKKRANRSLAPFLLKHYVALTFGQINSNDLKIIMVTKVFRTLHLVIEHLAQNETH